MSLTLTSKAVTFNIDSASLAFQTIADMEAATADTGAHCVLTDENRGGVFVLRDGVAGDENGGTIFVSGTTGKFWHRQYEGAVNVKWFGANEDRTDNEVPIQAALDIFGKDAKGEVDISSCTFTISGSILVRRGKSIIGDSKSEIIADFSSGNWGGDYVAIKYIVDESPTAIGVLHNSSQHSRDFTLTGKNNGTIISYGMKFYTSFVIDVGVAVNYSFLLGKLSNISIRRFDTALYMLEVNSSSFNNVNITECREGILVDGKSVNVVINNIYIANSTNSFTSSVDTTVGFRLQSSTRYNGGVEGRPEGFSFNGGAIMAHYNNLYLSNGLSINFYNVMLDLAAADSVVVSSINFLTIKGSYIFTSSASHSCIRFNPLAVGSSQQNIIDSNYLVASNNGAGGIYFPDGGARRTHMSITNNKFAGTTGMTLIQCPDYSIIRDNTSETHYGTRFIYVQNGGVKTVIDGNSVSTASVVVLTTHPAVTSANLNIGTNTSLEMNTAYSGYVTLPASATSVAIPTYMGAGTTYLYGLATITPTAPIGDYSFTPNTAHTNGTLTVSVAPVADVAIYYTCKAVPFTARAV